MYTTKSLFTRANFDVNQTIFWQMLSDDQCEEIVLTAFELLERTGADVQSKAAREFFAKGGCWVDGNRVRIPSAKLEWALRTAPSRVTLCDRKGKRALLLEATNVHFGPGFGAKQIMDANSDEPRALTKADVADLAKLCDELDNVDFLMEGGLPSDVEAKSAGLHAFEALVSYSSKPVIQPVGSVAEAEAVAAMAAAVAGGEVKLRMNPFVALYVAAGEPLSHSAAAMDIVICAAEAGLPVIYGNELVTGLTAPSASAGALVVALANALIAIVLAQLVKEGAAVISGGFFTINDTKNEMQPYGAPEVSLLGAGYANLMRYLRLPSFSFGGGSDAKISDAQMGMESAFSLLHAGLSGANLVYGAGAMESGLTASTSLLAIGNEVMGMTRRIMRGIEVNEDRLARGVIDEVQPGGHYLGEEHTMYYFKTEQFWPKLMNRARIDDWIAAGSKSLGLRAKEHVAGLLEYYAGEPLDKAVASQLKDIITKAEAAL